MGYPVRKNLAPVVFVLACAVCASPWATGPIALFAGIALALAGLTAFGPESKKASKILVQTCVVLLGLRLDLGTLLGAAWEGLAFAVATIAGTFALGWALGRLLRTGGELSVLVNSGTAICGASAIAAVGTSIRAAPGSMAVATGSIFVLNAVGLLLLPALGHRLGMSPEQFGTWAGVALHDVASVAAAAGSYGTDAADAAAALDTANVVKMTRVLWILPIAMIAAYAAARKDPSARGRAPVPWFILLFMAASGLRTLVPQIGDFEHQIRIGASAGFRVALFLIGAGLSWGTLKAVGWRTFAHAGVLWVAVAAAGAMAILATS